MTHSSFQTLSAKALRSGKVSTLANAVNGVKIPGKYVELMLRQWMVAKMVCKNNNLRFFPFDESNCQIEILLYGSPQESS